MPSDNSDTTFIFHNGDVLNVYEQWTQPDCLIVDGPYGVGGFFGDPRTPDSLAGWYRPHIEAWSNAAKPSTTLWFWGTEIGWATVHPVFVEHGWEYVQVIHWDKGIGHVAGNVNSKTIRQFPVANEICVFYTRRFEVPTADGLILAKRWLLDEWLRTELPKRKANEACNVKDAATRKYFDQGWRWYMPPAARMQQLVDYANEHGNVNGRPYYAINGTVPVTGTEWERLRYRWNHVHGLTNVWQHPTLRNSERVKNQDGTRQAPRLHNPTAGVSSAHLNQKPVELMNRILDACTVEGDVVWEPFGGLCSASVAAIKTRRVPYTAEIDDGFAEMGVNRLRRTSSLK